MTSILNEGYVYLDFLKAPKQPKGYDDYIPKVDLISELNAINKKDRYFRILYNKVKIHLYGTTTSLFKFTRNL